MANPKTKTDEQIGAEAAKIARQKVLAQANDVRLTTRRVLQAISDGLDAMENKVFYDKDRGKCIVGPAMIDHGHRLEAAGMGIMIHDMKPCEKKKIDVNHSGSIMAAVASELSKQPEEDTGKEKKVKPKRT